MNTVIKTVEYLLLRQYITVKVGGKARKVSKLEGLIIMQTNKGLQGDRRAANDIINIAMELAAVVTAAVPEPGSLEDDLAIYHRMMSESPDSETDWNTDGDDNGDEEETDV